MRSGSAAVEGDRNRANDWRISLVAVAGVILAALLSWQVTRYSADKATSSADKAASAADRATVLTLTGETERSRAEFFRTQKQAAYSAFMVAFIRLESADTPFIDFVFSNLGHKVSSDDVRTLASRIDSPYLSFVSSWETLRIVGAEKVIADGEELYLEEVTVHLALTDYARNIITPSAPSVRTSAEAANSLSGATPNAPADAQLDSFADHAKADLTR
jgi:hypothetical protein